MKEEVPEALRQKLITKCGSYRNALFQIGLEPVEKKREFSIKQEVHRKQGEKKHRRVLEECYYQVLTKDAQYQKDIRTLWEWREKERKLPQRRDIDPDEREDYRRSVVLGKML